MTNGKSNYGWLYQDDNKSLNDPYEDYPQAPLSDEDNRSIRANSDSPEVDIPYSDNEDKDLQACDCCGDLYPEDELATTVFGMSVCPYCWEDYVEYHEESILEYLFAIAYGETDINDYDLHDYRKMVDMWDTWQDLMDLPDTVREQVEETVEILRQRLDY